MKFGIEWDSDRSYSIEEQTKNLKDNGFEATFVNLEDERLEKILTCLKKYDIVCENCHAPFNGINDMWIAGEKGDRMLNRLFQCVDDCARYHIPTLIVHLSSGQYPPRINDIGFARYDRLMQYATEKGVVIAYENIRRLDNVAFAMENYPQAGFCWDVGHEACYMNGMEFMPLFGKRLAAIHLHDNTGIYDEDLHRLPYDGVIDMDRAAMHLADSNYGGALMLEVTRRTAGIESLDDFYPKAYAAAKRFAERVEFYRSGKEK